MLSMINNNSERCGKGVENSYKCQQLEKTDVLIKVSILSYLSLKKENFTYNSRKGILI